MRRLNKSIGVQVMPLIKKEAGMCPHVQAITLMSFCALFEYMDLQVHANGRGKHSWNG